MLRFCTILCVLKYILSEKIVSDIVSTTTGDVQGIVKFTEDDVPYTAFLGIPFGEIPQRFQEAKPKKRVNSTIKCFDDGPVCLQTNLLTNEPEGSEDCLNLNLFTPLTNFSTKPRELLPVLFWIHGGGFLIGSADSCKYGPDGFIYHGVIFVSVNYRLGVFGWTFLQDSRLPGDAGLKDQLLALHWVRDNIAQFGGDPGRITLGGHSAGSISATAHAISDRSRGLFHQIIAMSGTICNFWGYHTQLQAQLTAFKLGQLLNNNVPVANTDELIKLLNEIPSEVLSLKVNELILLPSMRVGMDTYSPNNTAFLTKCYHKKLTTGNYKPVPTMIGFNKNEILFFLQPLNKVVVEVKKFFKKLRNSKNLLDQLVSASFEKAVTDFIITTILDFSQIVSQIAFDLEIDECQRAMCSSRNSIEAPVYYYLFNYDAKEYSLHYQRANVTELTGTGHEDEINLIFNACPKHSKYPQNPNHPIHFKKKQMRALLANFVKYGNPTPFGSKDEQLKVTWPDSCSGGHHLLIGDELSVEYKRPTRNLTKVLTPFAELREPFKSDCFDVDDSDDFEPVLSLETTLNTFIKYLNLETNFNTFIKYLTRFWDSFWQPQKHMVTWERMK